MSRRATATKVQPSPPAPEPEIVIVPPEETESFAIKDGFRAKQVDAKVISDTLKRLGSETTGVSPRSFLDASRDPDSPTHHLFEWNNDVAGEKYRLSQASYYIRAVSVRITYNDKPVDVRAFQLSEDLDGAAVYKTAMTAFANQETSARIVERAKGELESWKFRYRVYQFLSDVVPLADGLIEKLNELGQKKK